VAFYQCYQTGCTYRISAVPGDNFSTNDQAMVAGAMYAENQSLLNDGNEQCGMTYSASFAQYTFEPPHEGSANTCVPQTMPTNPLDAPTGPILTGRYHSHGVDDPNAANDRFSGQPGDEPGDVYWSTVTGFPLAVATPGGNVIVYYPRRGCQTFFLGGPVGTGTNLPIRQ
jgi:hypothetical protein